MKSNQFRSTVAKQGVIVTYQTDGSYTVCLAGDMTDITDKLNAAQRSRFDSLVAQRQKPKQWTDPQPSAAHRRPPADQMPQAFYSGMSAKRDKPQSVHVGDAPMFGGFQLIVTDSKGVTHLHPISSEVATALVGNGMDLEG